MLPGEFESDQLADKQQVTLILRLLVDENSRLVHGEVVDVAGKPWGHFTSWESLVTLLTAWQSIQMNRKT